MNWASTELTRRFSLSAPIISAPMAGVAGGALAAAVSRAGALGLIGGGYGDRAWLEREFDVAGDAPVGVGFIAWALARDPDLLTMALERRPRAVMLSFGDLKPFAAQVARAGAPLIVQVQTVAAARAAIAEGADFIVAQGAEAGGHGGDRATLALVPAIIDAVAPVPVIAAGGVADGRGLAAVMALGACGALCGTAFYAAQESLAHPNAKAAALRASGDDTVKGGVFDVVRGYDWPKPWRIRTLRNAFYDRWADHVVTRRDEIAGQRAAFTQAQAQGDLDIAAVVVGEAVDLVRAIEPAGAIVARMVEEGDARICNLAGRAGVV